MLLLGFNSKHHDTQRLWDVVCGVNTSPDFKVYDDIDVISDLPAPIYLTELLKAYPEAKVILTIRDTEDWWQSIQKRFNKKAVREPSSLGRIAMRMGLKWWPRQRTDKSRMFKIATRRIAYGSATPEEVSYKKRYEAFNQHVIDTVPRDRLLVMNICEGEGWERLCPFVGCEIPPVDFMNSNSH
jgi:hypothetical protein